VLSPVPHLGWKDAVDWQAEEPRYRDKVAAQLETVMPGFRERISTEFSFTPETFRDRYLSPHGCGFSIEPRILQSAWFRPHNVSEEARGSRRRPSGRCRQRRGRCQLGARRGPGTRPKDGRRMIDATDLEHCRAVIRTGSLSFHAASKLLPASVRDPALALYAFWPFGR